MSEGEFKKRIVEFQTLEGHKKYYERNPEKYHYGITNEDFTKEIMDWIDEAKKELKNPEIYRKFIYKYGSSDDEYFEKLRFLYYWINKWFGDIE